MAILFKNNAASTLDYMYQAPGKDFVDIYVIDPTVFPTIAPDSNDYFYLTLVGDDTLEIVKVFAQITNVNTGKLAFRSYRAQEGTTAQEWVKGTRVEMRITADALNSFVPTAVQLAKDYVDATGVASTTNVGFAGVDGKTTQADAGGVITAKDVAIGGDLGDLASARGQIGDLRPIRIADFNTFLESGVYRGKWADDDNPGLNTPPGTVNGIVYVASCKNAAGKITECRQIVYQLGTPGSNDWNIFTREMMNGGTWSPWRWILTDASLGDGLRFSGGKLSVPEYVGATASAAGTSGLVPPAAAGQHESFLTGGGEYKPALTKISDSVSLKDSKTAASSKAVKTAYDLADSKLPISGGTITGGLTINGGLNSHQNINLTSDEANGLAIALYNTSNAILSSLRFKNNLITVEKGVFSADGVYSRGNMQLRTDDSNGLAIALYGLDGVSLYNAVRLKKDGTVSLEFQPLDISQGGTGARDAATARTNLFVPARPQNEEGPGQFKAIGVSAAQFTLPSGGSWAYSVIATDSSRLISVVRSGVDAGGSTIYFGSNITALFGFCWRWQ